MHLFKKIQQYVKQNGQITRIIILYSGAKNNFAAILQIVLLQNMRSIMFITFTLQLWETECKIQEVKLYDL